MSKATINIEGFVASDPELRDAQGKSVVNVDVPHTPRKRNQQGDWEDAGPTTWFQATFWEELAPVIAQTVRKGTLVRIEGMPELNVYQKQDGSTGASVRIKGATLSVVARAPREGHSAPASNPAPDVWATSSPTQSQGGYDGSDGTPF